jgi:D-glycero-D-manno-heptose 1,7-bisphosphate phosphatase
MKLVILDRDGVINHDSDDFIKSPAEWNPIEGSLEAIAQLNQAGFRVAVATNQSGIARGLYDMATLNAMHDKMHRLLAAVGGRIDGVFFCPHRDSHACDCRKPKPGLLNEISRRFGVALAAVPFVGDTVTDLQAARAAGAVPFLVRTGKGLRTLAEPANQPLLEGVQVFDDLAAVAHQLSGAGA